MGHGKRTVIILLAGWALCAASPLNAAERASSPNRLRNGSFERVRAGRPDWWGRPMLPLEQFASYAQMEECVRVVETGAFHGKRCLRLKSSPTGGQVGIGKPQTCRIKTEKGAPQVVSFYLRAESPGVKVYVLFCVPGGRLIAKNLEPTTEWKRYHLASHPSGGGKGYVSFKLVGEGTVYLDAVQWESGTEPTPFAPHELDAGKKPPRYPRATVRAARADGPITLDGRLDEAAWKKAPALPFVLVDDPERKPTQGAEARVLFDEDNIYVAVTCLDSHMDKLRATMTQRDEFLFGDDSVEIFFAPDPNGMKYMQLVVNALGTRYDGWVFNFRYNWGWKVRTRRGADRWTVEAAFPHAMFGPEFIASDTWGFNIGRNCHTAGECSTILKLPEPNFLKPSLTAFFPKPEARALKTERFRVRSTALVLDEGTGNTTIVLAASNKTKGERTVAAVASFTQHRVRMCARSAPVLLKPGGQTTIRLTGFRFEPRTDYVVNARLEDAVTAEPLAFSNDILDVRRAINGYLDRSFYSTEKEARFIYRLDESVADKAAFLRLAVVYDGVAVRRCEKRITGPAGSAVMSLKALKRGSGELVAIVVEEDGKRLAMRRFPFAYLKPQANETKIDRVGRSLLVGGAPYVPFAWLCHTWTVDQAEHLRRAKAAGVEDVFMTIGSSAQPKYEAFFKSLEGCGLNIIFAASWVVADKHTTFARTVIPKYNKLPGLISWFVIDEPFREERKVMRYFREVKGLDPHHPFWCNYTPNGLEGRFADACGDIISIDHYTHWSELGATRPLAKQYYLAREMEKIARRRRIPTFYWLQTDSYSWRAFSGEEWEVQVYMALVGGCKGIGWFTGMPSTAESFRIALRLQREIRELTAFICSPEDGLPGVASGSPGRVPCLLRRSGSSYVLMTVNLERKPTTATFDLSKIPGIERCETAKVLFEDRRVALKAGRITDSFAPYSRHVYRIDF